MFLSYCISRDLDVIGVQGMYEDEYVHGWVCPRPRTPEGTRHPWILSVKPDSGVLFRVYEASDTPIHIRAHQRTYAARQCPRTQCPSTRPRRRLCNRTCSSSGRST